MGASKSTHSSPQSQPPPPQPVRRQAPPQPVRRQAPPTPVRQPSPPPPVRQPSPPPPVRHSQIIYNHANNYIIPHFTPETTSRQITLGCYRQDRFHLKICAKYLSKKGCNTKYCYRFHVCQFWIKGDCKKSDCPFDHDFKSKDNYNLWRALYARRFSETDLIEKLRRNLYSGKHLMKDDDNDYICMDFIIGKCQGGDKCTGIHVRSPYLWEMLVDGKWVSFPRNLNEDIEMAFSDPKNDDFVLQIKKSESNRGHSNFLLKYKDAVIDFEDMSMKTANCSTFKVRRLTTPSDLTIFKSVATRWLWYWQKNDDWIFFNNGIVNEFLIIAFSDYIELQFIKKNEIVEWRDHSCSVPCSIQFGSMLGKNNYDNSYKIRRRPMYIHEKKKKNAEVTFISLWSISSSNQRFTRQMLSHNSSEFIFVQNMIYETLPEILIDQIERVENLHLWQFYQLNKERMKKIYSNNSEDLNEQYLFHGTSESVLDKICSDNLDWRLYGTNVGNVFGRGVYFAGSAGYAVNYAKADSNQYKHMIVAFVLVGKVTVGNSKMMIPPIDPVSNRRYDSTVNDAQNPEIFVKYNLDDYYPAYIVKFKSS